MKFQNYFYVATIFASLSTSTFVYAKVCPEFQETQDQQFLRRNMRDQHNKQLVEFFYHNVPKEVVLDEIFNVATGKPLIEKTCPPKAVPLQRAPVDFTGTLETLKIPGAMAAFLHKGDASDALEIVKQVEEKHEKYKGPQPKRVDALKKAAFNNEIESEWDHVLRRRQVQKNEKYRLHTQNLTDVFQRDTSSVYDVVLKRENCLRSEITPSFYVGPEEVMPFVKRKRAASSEEWNDIWIPQVQIHAPKRKWAARNEEWNEKRGPQEPRSSKKRKWVVKSEEWNEKRELQDQMSAKKRKLDPSSSGEIL